MGDLQGKYHVIIDGNSYVLARNRNGVPYYTKRKAPTFVNKFGSGDSSYRDATFWQFFAQTNWRNGSQQLKFDDPGKFWKSENINTNQLEQIELSNKLTSTGQTDAGSNVLTINSWRPVGGDSEFGDGSDGSLTVSSNTTEAPIDSSCSGTINTTSLTATNASFSAGQKILIHQSRGTGVGNYEVNEISSYSTGTITTVDPLSYTYTDSGSSQAQVRVLKQYSDVTVDSTYTYSAKAWDGNVGGILAFLCNGTVTVTGTISADGKGYLGALGGSSADGTGSQGEGTAGARGTDSRNANESGGGGGVEGDFDRSGGGGGGGYAADGSDGDYAAGVANAYGGYGGIQVGTAALTTLFFGGGGGEGANGDNGVSGAGGSGGGIVLIISKNITVSGAITCDGANGSNSSGAYAGGGGGGAGGSVLIKSQMATLGTTKIGAVAGTGGEGTGGAGSPKGDGGDGSVGRIHLDYLNSYSGTTTPTLDVTQDGTLADTPAADSFTGYSGTSTGKIYSWDDGTTWTEEFDCRELEWYKDTDSIDGSGKIGYFSSAERAQAQSFQLDNAQTIKSIKAYLKLGNNTPGDITVRIETDSTGPTGTLADSNASTTIPAFTDTSYAWIEASFDTAFSLSASTTYWLVFTVPATGSENYYEWGRDQSSPTYGDGSNASSANGGTSWSVESGTDDMFAIMGESTSVNCSLVTDVGGTQKMLFGVGNPSSTTDGEARIISYDGTTWAINKVFTSESQVLSLEEFNDAGTDKVMVGVGPGAVIYETDDLSTYTSSKDIKKPQNPGYPWALKEYNRYLYALGGSPEQIPTQYYNGFVYVYDTTEWNSLYPFDFTVLKSAEFYDAYLFMGTYHGQLFVYDTASLNPIFDFNDLYEYDVTVRSLKYYNDKLYVGLIPQSGSGETNVGIWVYDRHGLSLAYHNSGITGYYCMSQINNELLVGCNDGYVYKIDADNYQAQGFYQSSYFDANLPSINKLYNEVEIKHDPLPANTTVVVYYKFKESDSWTTLGTSSTDDAESATFSFATGIYSKKISLKVELNTSDSTTTPKVTEVVMKYSLLPETKWKWDFRILAKESLKLRDRTESTDDAATIRANIEASLSGTQLVTFTDVDTTDYTVLFNDSNEERWAINPDTANENMISVSLIEA